jgi:RecB family endonuclease NucS
LPKRSADRKISVAKARKYGSGGEGKDHKQLKEYIARHPEVIGLQDVVDCECDKHRFLSGDLPDLVFTQRNGMYSVVEIETIDPLPGAHQAIKYRSLLSAEKRLTLDTKKVKAMLVAWNIPPDVRDFCKDYGIGCREHKI